jgi:hypothetical protein
MLIGIGQREGARAFWKVTKPTGESLYCLTLGIEIDSVTNYLWSLRLFIDIRVLMPYFGQ